MKVPSLYTQENKLRVSKCVFPLFNTESNTFYIRNNDCIEGPYETISRLDEQLVHTKSFQKANGASKIRPEDSQKFKNS